jgi:hypothetical protein
MPLWLSCTILAILFLVTGFLGIWAIREGGSFAFLTPSYWKKEANRTDPVTTRRE